MKEKIFLTSCIAMGVIAPAFAEPSNTGEFPSTGLMQEDYTYTNAATSTNMDGVYSGTVNAVAEYDIIDYIVNAGQYLPADSETVITCPAGSYCPGISGNVQYNQSSAQGIQTCPTGYANSAAGASADTDCYRTCTNADVAHSTGTMNGGYYYGDNNQCEPTDCVNGWHVKVTPNLTNIIGVSEAGTKAVYKSVSGSVVGSSNESDLSTYGITQNGEFVVDYGNKGKIHGHAQCSNQSGGLGTMSNGTYPDITTTTNLPDSAGQYCYCQLDSYTTSGGVVTTLSAPWVFRSDVGSGCTSYCTARCVLGLNTDDSDNLAFRAAVFGTIESSPAMCEANVININWNDVDPEYAGQNNEGTATYGEDVRTPVKAATKKGKTFRGWRFSAPEQTNLP